MLLMAFCIGGTIGFLTGLFWAGAKLNVREDDFNE